MGMTMLRDVRPKVGLMPTMLLFSAGRTILPLVSVANAPDARPNDAATALPLELPEGSCRG